MITKPANYYSFPLWKMLRGERVRGGGIYKREVSSMTKPFPNLAMYSLPLLAVVEQTPVEQDLQHLRDLEMSDDP